MESSSQISADLKSVLLEKHLNFELLNTYKGVPFVCKALLQDAGAGVACFSLAPVSPFAWETVDNTLILSEGLLEPIEARILTFDRKAGALRVGDFFYAGSKLSNRKELRVEPEGAVEVALEAEGQQKTGYLADLSMRGAGLRLIDNPPSAFGQGRTINLHLRLADSNVNLSGKVRNISRTADIWRLSVEFIGATPDKTPIVRYIMHRRVEIMAEMQQMSKKE